MAIRSPTARWTMRWASRRCSKSARAFVESGTVAQALDHVRRADRRGGRAARLGVSRDASRCGSGQGRRRGQSRHADRHLRLPGHGRLRRRPFDHRQGGRRRHRQPEHQAVARPRAGAGQLRPKRPLFVRQSRRSGGVARSRARRGPAPKRPRISSPTIITASATT